MTPMRRARRDRSDSFQATSVAQPAVAVPRGLASHIEVDYQSTSTVDEPVAEVRLSPAGTFTQTPDIAPADRFERNRQLAIAIRQRIETRLPGRVRRLAVRIFDGTVVLEGECATYYTKQLAQHAALGILEDEQLENAIEVCVR